MSSFVKKGKSSKSSGTPVSAARLAGTRPWLNSSVLISTGSRSVDAILSGGQPLHTSLLIEEDRFTDYGETLTRYWVAEGVASKQRVVIVSFDDGGSVEEMQLPLDMNLCKAEQKLAQLESNASTMDALAEGNEEGEDSDFEEEKTDTGGDDHLKIAWQYKTSIQEKRGTATNTAAATTTASAAAASTNVFCHSYDLSKSMQQELLDASTPVYVNLRGQSGNATSLFAALVKSLPAGAHAPTRVLLRRPPYKATSTALNLFVSHIRSSNLPVAVCVTVQPWLTESEEDDSGLVALGRVADTSMRIDSFLALQATAPPEFRDFVGICTVRKIASLGGYMPPRPVAMRWGIKRDRRKLHVKMLHLPPEDYSDVSPIGMAPPPAAATSGSLGDSKKKPALSKGMGCSTGIGGANPLEF